MPIVRYTIDFELDLYFLLLVINRSLIFIIVVVMFCISGSQKFSYHGQL